MALKPFPMTTGNFAGPATAAFGSATQGHQTQQQLAQNAFAQWLSIMQKREELAAQKHAQSQANALGWANVGTNLATGIGGPVIGASILAAQPDPFAKLAEQELLSRPMQAANAPPGMPTVLQGNVPSGTFSGIPKTMTDPQQLDSLEMFLSQFGRPGER